MCELVLAAAIAVKGSEGRYMLDKILNCMAEAGHGREDHHQVGPRARGRPSG